MRGHRGHAVRDVAGDAELPVSLADRRISGPAELLQALPYLLGFHPRESLVLVGLAAGNLVVTARLDLSDAVAGAALAETLAAMAAGGADSVVAAVYDDVVLPVPCGPAARHHVRVGELLDLAGPSIGIEPIDLLLVARGDGRGARWRSLWCRHAGCCPERGLPLPDAPSAFTASATVEGVAALPDREALAATLAADGVWSATGGDAIRDVRSAALADALTAVEQATQRGEVARWERAVKRELFAAARALHTPGWVGPAEAERAKFGVALQRRAVRDRVWLATDGRRLDGRPLWADLGRTLPPPLAAQPLLLYGWASWRRGNGALAGIAAERALDDDPQCTAADLLLAAVTHAVDPRSFPRLRVPRPA